MQTSGRRVRDRLRDEGTVGVHYHKEGRHYTSFTPSKRRSCSPGLKRSPLNRRSPIRPLLPNHRNRRSPSIGTCCGSGPRPGPSGVVGEQEVPCLSVLLLGHDRPVLRQVQGPQVRQVAQDARRPISRARQHTRVGRAVRRTLVRDRDRLPGSR